MQQLSGDPGAPLPPGQGDLDTEGRGLSSPQRRSCPSYMDSGTASDHQQENLCPTQDDDQNVFQALTFGTVSHVHPHLRNRYKYWW